MLEKLVKCYRELGLSKTESMFLAEIIVSKGKYLESHASYTYNSTTIKKIRASLKDKGLLTWKVKSIFCDNEYIYDLTLLKSKLESIVETKPQKPDLGEILKEMKK